MQAGRYSKGTLGNYIECLSSSLNNEQPAYEELFNLKDDPREKFNLTSDKKYEKILNELRTRTTELGKEKLPKNGVPDTRQL